MWYNFIVTIMAILLVSACISHCTHWLSNRTSQIAKGLPSCFLVHCEWVIQIVTALIKKYVKFREKEHNAACPNKNSFSEDTPVMSEWKRHESRVESKAAEAFPDEHYWVRRSGALSTRTAQEDGRERRCPSMRSTPRSSTPRSRARRAPSWSSATAPTCPRVPRPMRTSWASPSSGTAPPTWPRQPPRWALWLHQLGRRRRLRVRPTAARRRFGRATCG